MRGHRRKSSRRPVPLSSPRRRFRDNHDDRFFHRFIEGIFDAFRDELSDVPVEFEDIGVGEQEDAKSTRDQEQHGRADLTECAAEERRDRQSKSTAVTRSVVFGCQFEETDDCQPEACTTEIVARQENRRIVDAERAVGDGEGHDRNEKCALTADGAKGITPPNDEGALGVPIPIPSH